MWRSIGALIALLVLAGCAPPVDPNAPLQVKVSGDAFSKDITLTGPLFHQERLASYAGETWGLRSFVDPKAHTATHQLYAQLDYDKNIANNVYYAADNSARDYKPKVIYRERCGRSQYCTIDTDHLTIDVDEATLRANAASGMAFKFSANSGYAVIVKVSPRMIAAQLDAEQRVLSGAVVVGQTVPSGESIVTASNSPPTPPPPDEKPAPTGNIFRGLTPRDLPSGGGIVVDRVDPGTPAELAGVQVGDRITGYDGHPVKTVQELQNLIAKTPPGKRVNMDLIRHREPVTVSPQS